MCQWTVHGVNHLVSESFAGQCGSMVGQLVLLNLPQSGLAFGNTPASRAANTFGTGRIRVGVLGAEEVLGKGRLDTSSPFGIVVLVSLVGLGPAA